MPCWYFERDELLHSPSEADGINAETESRYREEGAGFIIELANKLGIQYDTYAAAVVYFHRFHVLQSFRNFHRHVTATSCLLLSSKTQENKTTMQDLLKTIKLLLSEKQFSVFGVDPQQEVVQTEMSLLETLKFDLDVIHPYAYLLHYTKLLKGEKEVIQQILHTSWTFVNDSLYTTLCVQYEPDLLAVAFLYLACRLTKFEVTDWIGKPDNYSGKWYSHFVSDMNIEILKDICGQVLGLYSKGKKGEPLVTRTSSSRARDGARSPSPAVVRSSRRRSGSPAGQRRSGRRSMSPLPRRPDDLSSVGRGRLYDLDRSPPPSLRSRRLSRSRSRSRHRRSSYSRSPEWRRLERPPVHLSRSPPPSSVPVAAPPPEPGTYFLSRQSFEEIQAQLRAKSSQPPPPEPYNIALPPPRFAQYPEPPMQPYVPLGYPPVGFRQPPPQMVVAFPFQQQSALPPPSHQPYPPGVGYPPRAPEFVGPSQILIHQPHQVLPPRGQMMTLHPVHHMPGPPHAPPPHPHPNQEMHLYGQPPGPFPDVRGPYPPPQFEGPPPGVPRFMRPPPPFVEGPRPPMPPHVEGSPGARFESGQGMFGVGGEGPQMERSPEIRMRLWNNHKGPPPPPGSRSNLINIPSLEPIS